MRQSYSLLRTLLAITLMAMPYIGSASEYRIDHLEPAFWWAGMNSSELQLLVHGKNISELTPSISSEDVILKRVNLADSPNYLFLDLIVDQKVKAQTFTINFSRDDKVMASYQYQLKSRRKQRNADVSFGTKDVIYLITPDRFANGNAKNDQQLHLTQRIDRQAPDGRHGGDLQGIINHLNYIQDMGFTQLWLNPVVENNQESYSYHGYSATDFYQVDARFGDNQLYLALSEQASERGIGLIIDVVLNHGGTGHWWHNDLPMNDWYNHQNKPYVETNHQRESRHDPYAITSDVKKFTDGWFVPTMPDLNQRNPYLAKYLTQNTIWWVEFANLSGIRVDTYSYPDKDFLQQWTASIINEYPNINIVGEEWTTDPVLVSYWQKGKVTHDGYQPQLPSLMDFPLQNALVKALTHEEKWNTGLTELYRTLANDFLYPDANNLVIFGDNHDMSRLYTQLNEDISLYKMAMSFLMTTRGIPQVLYGSEILMTNPNTDAHGVIRTDFPGGWPNDKVNAFTGAGLTSEQRHIQQFTQKLLTWRRQEPTIYQGQLKHYAPKNGTYVYFRYDEYKKFMVVLNKNEQPVDFKPSEYQEMLADAKLLKDVLTQQSVKLSDTIVFPEKSALIFQVF